MNRIFLVLVVASSFVSSSDVAPNKKLTSQADSNGRADRRSSVAMTTGVSKTSEQRQQPMILADAEPESLRPDPCRSSVSAMSVVREEYHIFSGKWFWRVNRRSGLVKDDPMEIHLMWYVLPIGLNQIDAVYERSPNGKIVFFIGSLYWELDDNRSGKFPKSGRSLTDLGLPEEVDRVDAAFVWPRDNRTYLVVGDQLWRLNSSGGGVEGDSLRMRFNRDSKIREPIDAAFKDLKGNVYFLQGDYFWAVKDLVNMTTSPRQLRNESVVFGCNRETKTEMSPLRNVSVRIRTPQLAFLTALLLVVGLLGNHIVSRV